MRFLWHAGGLSCGWIVPSGFGLHALFWIRSLKLTRRWFFPSGFLGDLVVVVRSPCFWIMILCPGCCLTRIAKRSQGRQTKQLMKWDQEKLSSKSSLEVTLHSKHHEGICLRQQWQEQTSLPWCNFNKPSVDKMKTCIQTKSEARLKAQSPRQ